MPWLVSKGFGAGANLKDAPDIVRPDQALDLLNVSFSDVGGVRSRYGYGNLTSAQGTNRYDSLSAFYKTGGTKQIVAGAGNRLDAISTAGAVVASSTSPTASPHYFARFGGPTAEVVYCANGTDQLRTWNGTAFATPTYTGTAPTGKYVAFWQTRLVNARRSGSTGGDNVSSVRFSDPGVPNTWGANNYVDLDPGDGEQITGMAVWNEYLFVFKQSKFFVFYGVDTDATGQPIFRYREITGVGAVGGKAIASGRDAVYFVNERGVYRTVGGPAQLVSSALDPLFLGGVSDFYRGLPINQAQLANAAVGIWQERVYVAVPTGTSTSNDRTLVFDPEYGWWSIYDLPIAGMDDFTVASEPELVFALASGNKHICRHSESYTTDAGATIASRIRLAWTDFDSDSRRKVVREAKVWGKGKAFVGLSVNYNSSVKTTELPFTANIDTWGDGAGPDTWGSGTGPDVWGSGASLTEKYYRIAHMGTVFSTYIANVDATPWAVSRISYHIL